MSWLLLLAIFWKPIMWLVRYLIRRDDSLTKIKNWFLSLWSLVSPVNQSSQAPAPKPTITIIKSSASQ